MIARRILICLHDFHRGGTERIAIGLAKSWVEAGREVTILCGDTAGGLYGTVDPRVKVVALDPPMPRSPLSRFLLGAAMGRHLAVLKPDLIFLPGNFHLFLANGLRGADPRPAIALKISNPPVPHGIAGLIAGPLFRHFTRAVDGFAAMNAGLARELEALLPGRPIATLHDPVYIGETAEAPQRREGVRNILWIGRLEPQKDVGLALATIRALNKIAPAHLTILGDGALRDQTDRRIAAMKLGDVVTRLGHVPAIEPWLAGADALLITSRYEGGPAVAVEALARGVPVVSTDCSHLLHDLIAIPQAGAVVPSRRPRDLAVALAALGDHPPRKLLASIAAPFAPQVCARAYLDWFDTLVADHAA